MLSDESANEILASVFGESKPRKVVTASLNISEPLPLKIKQEIWVDHFVEIYYAKDKASHTIQMNAENLS